MLRHARIQCNTLLEIIISLKFLNFLVYVFLRTWTSRLEHQVRINISTTYKCSAVDVIKTNTTSSRWQAVRLSHSPRLKDVFMLMLALCGSFSTRPMCMCSILNQILNGNQSAQPRTSEIILCSIC